MGPALNARQRRGLVALAIPAVNMPGLILSRRPVQVLFRHHPRWADVSPKDGDRCPLSNRLVHSDELHRPKSRRLYPPFSAGDVCIWAAAKRESVGGGPRNTQNRALALCGEPNT